MQDTIVLFETMESLTKNIKLLLEAAAWLKTQRPEMEVKIVILPAGMKNSSEN